MACQFATPKSEPRDVSAILLSPWPESLFTFEQMWSRLAEHAHLVAIDLPGFGHSERRDELLTPSAMGEFVARVVREFGLKRPHAVGPDIGTSTLLFAAAKHPGLLRSIVLGNGTAAVKLWYWGLGRSAPGANWRLVTQLLGLPLIERCAVCFVEDPLLPNANAFSPIPSCWKCGSALFSYDVDERASSIVGEIISLESAILELMTGRPPNRTWARLSPDPAFVEKLRILIEDLTTSTDDRVPPFLRIFDADPQWRRYLFGRQRPETQVEAMSWYWRFLLMMTLVRKLSWTCKFQRIGAVYDLSAVPSAN